MKNKAAKALNAGIKNLNSDEEKSSSSNEKSSSSSQEDSSSSEENSSSSEEEDDSSSKENSSSEEEKDTPVVSKLPTFEFFFDQENLGVDYFLSEGYLDDSDDSLKSISPVDVVNQFQPKIGGSKPRSSDVSENKEFMEDEYSTFAMEKNPTLDFSLEQEELGIEDAEYVLKENAYFPNFQGPEDIFQKSDEIKPIFDNEDDELDLRRRDVENIVQNNVKSKAQKNEDCSDPNLLDYVELGFVVCLITETYDSITSKGRKT